jgi:hypothetical protein
MNSFETQEFHTSRIERISLLKHLCICEKQNASYNHFPLKMKLCINSKEKKLYLFSFSRNGGKKKESIYDGDEKLKRTKTTSYPEAKHYGFPC